MRPLRDTAHKDYVEEMKDLIQVNEGPKFGLDSGVCGLEVNAIDPADPSQTTRDVSGHFRNIFPSPTIGLVSSPGLSLNSHPQNFWSFFCSSKM